MRLSTLCGLHRDTEQYWWRINANGWATSDLFSWKKKTRVKQGYYESLPQNYFTPESTIFHIMLAEDPPSSHLEWIPFASSHGSPISAGFQLTLFTKPGWAEPFFLLFLQTVWKALDPSNCPFPCRAQYSRYVFWGLLFNVSEIIYSSTGSAVHQHWWRSV